MANDKEDILGQYMNEKYQGSKRETPDFSNRKQVDKIESKHELHYLELPISDMPMSMFYAPGTRIEIRPATVGEIQAYSVVNNKNLYDVTTKMNEILSRNVRVFFPDGSQGNYRDLFEGDKIYVITQISRYTMQNVKSLVVDAVCECNEAIKIEIEPKHFEYWECDESVLPYFDEISRQFVFPLMTGIDIHLKPPTIGIQQDIYAYIMDKVLKEVKPNVSFMKCGSWMVTSKKKELSIKDVEQLEFEYAKLDSDSFEFINECIEKLMFGIKHLVKKCPVCGKEVRTNFMFPEADSEHPGGKASALFVKSNAFERLLKK